MQWEIGCRIFLFEGPLCFVFFYTSYRREIEKRFRIQTKTEGLFLRLCSSWRNRSTSRSVGLPVVKRIQSDWPAFNGASMKNSNRWFIITTIKEGCVLCVSTQQVVQLKGNYFVMVEKNDDFWPLWLINKAKVVRVELNIMAVVCYSCCFRTLLCTLCWTA